MGLDLKPTLINIGGPEAGDAISVLGDVLLITDYVYFGCAADGSEPHDHEHNASELSTVAINL